jgi:exopolysaccharide production protein ExoQ
MSQLVASTAVAFLILSLFALERERKVRTSTALWLPTFWVLICASRYVAQWLGTTSLHPDTTQLLEGNPIDRTIMSALFGLGIIVLLCRKRRVAAILRMNWPILLFFSYSAVSTLWSDYPQTAMKRWIKSLGDIVMILIVLSDKERLPAIKRLLTRVGFLLIPLSVLLIEYFPSIGQVYSREDGMMSYTGVTLNKNSLGMLCLVIGIATVWRISAIVRNRYHRSRLLLAHGVILALVLWLLFTANSMTSLVCFLLGSGFIVALNMPGTRKPLRIHVIAGAMACSGLLVFLLPDVFMSFTHALGRNPTLTGRTQLWSTLLSMNTNPWFGTGFSSFWLGERLAKIWTLVIWKPNEAHNGYLGMYLNLGWVGVTLLGLLLLTGYRNVAAAFRRHPEVASLMLGFYVIAVVYNFTEEAFRLNDPIWIFFLMAITKLPVPSTGRYLDARKTAKYEILPEEAQDYNTRLQEEVV